MFLDLDGFKKVNDVLGHDEGDRVLKEVAIRLEEQTKAIDGFAVRLGGDEFIVSIFGVINKEEIIGYAKKMLLQLSEWETQIKELSLSVSIGIVMYSSQDNHSLQDLLKSADEALYRAKSNGKNTYQISKLTASTC